MVTNVGNVYNNNDGLFVAPVSGMYVFFWSVSATYDNNLYTELVKDGTAYAYSHADSSTSTEYVSAANSAVLQVNLGQHVYVRYAGGDRTIEGRNVDTFSGWLL